MCTTMIATARAKALGGKRKIRSQVPSRKECLSRQRRSVEEGHARLVAGSALHFANLAKRGVKGATRPHLSYTPVPTCTLATVMASLGRPGKRLRRCKAGLKAAETCTILGCLPTWLYSPVLCTSPVLPFTRKRCLITGVKWPAFQQRKQHARCYAVWVQVIVIMVT